MCKQLKNLFAVAVPLRLSHRKLLAVKGASMHDVCALMLVAQLWYHRGEVAQRTPPRDFGESKTIQGTLGS